MEEMASTAQDKTYLRELIGDISKIVNVPGDLDAANRATAMQIARRLTDALDTPQNLKAQQGLMVLSFPLAASLSLLVGGG